MVKKKFRTSSAEVKIVDEEGIEYTNKEFAEKFGESVRTSQRFTRLEWAILFKYFNEETIKAYRDGKLSASELYSFITNTQVGTKPISFKVKSKDRSALRYIVKHTDFKSVSELMRFLVKTFIKIVIEKPKESIFFKKAGVKLPTYCRNCKRSTELIYPRTGEPILLCDKGYLMLLDIDKEACEEYDVEDYTG